MHAEQRAVAITEGRVARMGLALANWSEKWFPDPLVFAFLGVVVVYLLGIAAGESPSALGVEAGKNFWTLIPFTMQMVMVILGGYIVASAGDRKSTRLNSSH